MMRHRSVKIACLIALGCCAAALGGAAPDTQPAAGISLDGDAVKASKWSVADIAALPHVDAHVIDHHGVTAVYSGVPLRALLLQAGAPIDHDRMRGKNLGLYLLISAADGYRVVFGLSELDAEYADHGILLADKRDGKALDASEGPLRVIVPDEKMQGRWIRQVTTMKVVMAP
jgi:hypothetical protein